MRTALMLVGAAGSGKDTAADAIMREIPGCGELKFALALKEICCKLFGWDIHNLTDDLDYKQAAALYPDGEPVMTHDDGTPYTRREIMQFIGTDLFRNQVRDDVWVRAALSEMRNTEKLRGVPTLWVLTDTRFENEFELVQEEVDNLFVIQVHREGHEIPHSAHESEQGWQSLPANAAVYAPDGHLPELCESVIGFTREFLREVNG